MNGMTSALLLPPLSPLFLEQLYSATDYWNIENLHCKRLQGRFSLDFLSLLKLGVSPSRRLTIALKCSNVCEQVSHLLSEATLNSPIVSTSLHFNNGI